MNLKPLPLLFPLMLAACLPASADEPANRNSHRTIPTVTLLVKTFSTLENDLLDAIQAKDKTAINTLVHDSFELRSASEPGRPTPREQFIAQSLKEAPFTSSISQMATHELGDVILVSYQWNTSAGKNTPLAQQMFVVDTWKKVDTQWQLFVRYAAPVAVPAKGVTGKRVPGVDSSETDANKKI